MFNLNFEVMKRKLLKSIALLLFMGMSGVFCVNSVYASFWDDYEFINCPNGMVYDPVIDACRTASLADTEKYVCVVKTRVLGRDILVFACVPEEDNPNCEASYKGTSIWCRKAKIEVNKI